MSNFATEISKIFQGKMGVVRRRQLKRSSLSEVMTKKGCQIFFKKKIG